MARELQCLIHWPSRKELRRNLPPLFKTSMLRHVRCIMERTTCLHTRAATYSHSKSYNTIEFLVGISPTWAFTFLSRVWGGHASYKVITKNSGLIDLLEQEHSVMADLSFNFTEYFSAKCVVLLVPSSTRERSELSGSEVSGSRWMSSIKIHVERAIGRRKVFRILQNTLPAIMVKRNKDDHLCAVDRMWIVCAALTNLGKPVVNQINLTTTVRK